MKKILSADDDPVVQQFVSAILNENGYEVLRLLREAPETRAIPVIILSAKSKEEDIIRGLEGGADDFIIKPFNALELVARVRKVLARPK